jgi:hypothetical protein
VPSALWKQLGGVVEEEGFDIIARFNSAFEDLHFGGEEEDVEGKLSFKYVVVCAFLFFLIV